VPLRTEANHLRGTPGADTIDARGGNDEIRARGGSDLVFAGDGNDKASGGTEDDEIHGGAGKDDLSGDAGNDVLLAKRGTINWREDAAMTNCTVATAMIALPAIKARTGSTAEWEMIG
jgi:Ca2+-binding RTX toxin-like protein